MLCIVCNRILLHINNKGDTNVILLFLYKEFITKLNSFNIIKIK